jgi:hypothetical protein
VLSKLDATTAVLVRYGSASTAYLEKVYPGSSISSGWNYLTNAITTGFTSTTGTVDLTSMKYTMIQYTTTAATETTSSGDIIFDSIRLASSDDYLKTISTTTVNETEASISYVSNLSVTEANGFLVDGHGLVNTDTNELLGVASKFPDNSKDTTDLLKFTTKLFISNKE